MAGIIEPRTLSGFMELLPQDQVVFEKIKNQLEKIYLQYGFYPLDTPILEDSRILLAKAGGETEKQIYRFTKGDTDLTMRFDLTVPLAKYVAKNYSDLTFPFRRYQIGKVYRGERAQRGRFREFYQADIDIIGDGKLSIINDAEIPSIIYSIFTGIGIDEFIIHINNRKVLNGLFSLLNIKDYSADIMRTIDKIEKIGRENVKAEILDMGVSEDAIDKILETITFKGSKEDILNYLGQFTGKDETFDTGLEELTSVVNNIKGFGVPDEYVMIDLAIARGLDYYTGTVYETFITGHPEYGSVCSGGRYDNLAEYYTKKSLPGVGISIGLTRLFHVLSDNGFLNRKHENPIDVLVIPVSDQVENALTVATAFRAAGINTAVYTETAKLKKKLTYANKLAIPFSVFINEESAENVELKNMESGDQVTISVDEAISQILAAKAELGKEKFVEMKK
ncbi:MAG: histidine--tRNA ligase [Eubacterium sp.]|nr:histidine--tRNA ligase [Eubacterium sp.]